MIVFTVEYSPFSVDSLLIGDNEPSSPSPSEPSFFTPLPVPRGRGEETKKLMQLHPRECVCESLFPRPLTITIVSIDEG